MPTLFRT